MQKIANSIEHPGLFTFINDPFFLKNNSAEDLVGKLEQVGKELWPAIDALISKHVALGERIIMEGDGFLPELLAKRDLHQVQTIFLWDELDALYENMKARNRHGGEVKDAEKRAAFSYHFGLKMKEQAEQFGFATLRSFPHETLWGRVLDELRPFSKALKSCNKDWKEEAQLIRNALESESGDVTLKEYLLPAVEEVADRYFDGSVPMEKLIEAGWSRYDFALKNFREKIEAFETGVDDPFKFSTYFIWFIRQDIVAYKEANDKPGKI